MLPECARKISCVASVRFMILYRFPEKQKVDPRIGPEVAVGCLGVSLTHYDSIWNLSEPFRTQIHKNGQKLTIQIIKNPIHIYVLNHIGPVWAGPYCV